MGPAMWGKLATLPINQNVKALFLETCAHTPDQQRLHAAVVTALDPHEGAYVLDLGCGTGVIARRLAEHIGATGSVLGIDLSRTMDKERMHQ